MIDGQTADAFCHTFRVLNHSPCHFAFRDQLFCRVRRVDAENRYGHASVRPQIIADRLQGFDGAFRHIVIVADDQLDHIPVFLVIPGKVGHHIFMGRGRGPFAGQVQLELVNTVLIEIPQRRIPRFLQDRVSVFHRVFGPVDGFRVGGLSFEQGIGYTSVPVQVDLGIMLFQITADHISLDMAAFRRIGSDKSHILIKIQNDALISVLFDRPVEKDDRNLLPVGLQAYGIRHVRIAGLDHVDNEDVGAS